MSDFTPADVSGLVWWAKGCQCGTLVMVGEPCPGCGRVMGPDDRPALVPLPPAGLRMPLDTPLPPEDSDQ